MVQGMAQVEAAAMLSCSQSSVHRSLVRYQQRMDRAWPPPISNGFGLSYDQRRTLRLRQSGGQDQGKVYRRFQVPPQLQDQDDEDEDGQGWASWTG
jgi:hypothetical protein